jgi:hypothetical protein
MTNKILSYRGLLASNGQERIFLSTKKGEKGYKITKFDVIPQEPSGVSGTNVVQIWKDEQTAGGIVDTINFSDNRLLGAAVSSHNASAFQYPPTQHIVFDQETINQDIYISQLDADGNNTACNYYLELEVIPLNEMEAMVATLKDIRNNS